MARKNYSGEFRRHAADLYPHVRTALTSVCASVRPEAIDLGFVQGSLSRESRYAHCVYRDAPFAVEAVD